LIEIFDEAQTSKWQYLRRLEANPRILVDGPAGTGKTLIALESARRAAAQGKQTLLLCFNSNLARHLAQQVDGTPNIQVATIHSWMLANSGGAAVDKSDPAWWISTLPEYVLQHIEHDSVQHLVIDESQDIIRDEWLAVLDEALLGGLEGGAWSMFADFSGQNLYSGDRELWDFLPATRCLLSENCRNTVETVEWMRLLQLVNPFYTEVLRETGGEVPSIRFTDEDGRPERLKDVLNELRDQKIAADDVVVLSPYRESATWNHADPSWAYQVSPIGKRSPGTIGVGTIHEFKGLESPVVILVDLGKSVDLQRNMLYVGITRATDRVVLIADTAIKGELKRLIMEGATV